MATTTFLQPPNNNNNNLTTSPHRSAEQPGPETTDGRRLCLIFPHCGRLQSIFGVHVGADEQYGCNGGRLSRRRAQHCGARSRLNCSHGVEATSRLGFTCYFQADLPINYVTLGQAGSAVERHEKWRRRQRQRQRQHPLNKLSHSLACKTAKELFQGA